ncbi:DUF58 domain-containing protein [Methylobacterium nodulans]|uniref:DUF58 domain-containing protein n=1 Tax=Methylobacterium nodulans (strain LMG 21967 / CNCM I-2342 / ORS 2060) TaxID=460265 RepID=B8IWY8_METNO|nr:DUF58 domain-containing protein [Methylobacterium nodulans]ACL63029.1 conserved hypothetical protein [Methylobacterium nodulans ORS 2060]
MSAPDILYRLRDPAAGPGPGAHRARDTGGPGIFRDQVPFWRHPDARRIDLRATLRDPFGTTMVRRFEQPRAVEVWVLLDLSASMRFCGRSEPWRLACDLCVALAHSATRIGDAFGLIGCDAGPREDVTLPATRRRCAAARVTAMLDAVVPHGRGAAGLVAAAGRLAGRRRLVLVVSDFRMPEAQVAALFDRLAPHDLVPVLVDDDALGADLPDFGLLALDDLEGGGRRLVLMRPALKARWLAREAAFRTALHRLALARGRPPYRLAGRLDADELSRHLLGTAA